MIEFFLVLAYMIGFAVTMFICFMMDYRTVVNEFWCDGHDHAVRFASQFVGFHIVMGLCWPIVLPLAILWHIFIGIGWCFSYVFGGVFGKLAKRFSK